MPMLPLFHDRMSLWGDESMTIYERMDAFNAPLSEYVSPPLGEVRDFTITGPGGEIPVRLYVPVGGGAGGSELQPCLIWNHGGGFEFGGLEQNESDVVSREIAARGDVVVIAVDYRLCNDGVTFPAPFEDAHAVLRWVAQNASELEVDANRIFIGGISAGGQIGAVVAVLDRDSGENLLAGQLLNCPPTHYALPEFSAELQAKLDEYGPDFGITRASTVVRNLMLCGGKPAERDPRWWPGDLDDLTGLPPAQIIDCEYDTLRADSELYAAKLKAAGVEVEHWHEKGVPHANINRYPADCEPTNHTFDEMVRWIKQH